MVGPPDLETGQSIPIDNNRRGDTEATILARKRGAEEALKQESLQAVAGFSESRLHAEKRVGVLLLLRYKYALDELNAEYTRFIYDENEILPIDLAASPIIENYVKALEAYSAHLNCYKGTSPSKEEYETSLIATAASITAHKRLLFKDADTMLLFLRPDANLELKPGASLIANSSTRWTWGSDRSRLHHAKFSIEQDAWSRTFTRSAFALLGGFALIIPMLIMKLYPTTLNVCLTTTLFVIATALLLGRFMEDTKPNEVLGITAAYAAVLVVFVGTSTTQSGLSNATVAIIMGTVVGVLVVLIGISTLWLYWRNMMGTMFKAYPIRIRVAPLRPPFPALAGEDLSSTPNEGIPAPTATTTTTGA